jgi:hypothetical protein
MELMVTIAIILIMASIVVPTFLTPSRRTKTGPSFLIPPTTSIICVQMTAPTTSGTAQRLMGAMIPV